MLDIYKYKSSYRKKKRQKNEALITKPDLTFQLPCYTPAPVPAKGFAHCTETITAVLRG